MKASNAFSYNTEIDQFQKKVVSVSDDVFMNFDETCHAHINKEKRPQQPIENLIKELVEDSLFELSGYIQMRKGTRTVIIDRTSLTIDGYSVVIH